jgi:hypothetical protein
MRNLDRLAVEAGGLMSYGAFWTGSPNRCLYRPHLKGEKPGDLPVQQPTKFELPSPKIFAKPECTPAASSRARNQQTSD